jgi:hypothetical protein
MNYGAASGKGHRVIVNVFFLAGLIACRAATVPRIRKGSGSA